MRNCRNCKYLTETPDTIDDKWIYYLDCEFGFSMNLNKNENICEKWEYFKEDIFKEDKKEELKSAPSLLSGIEDKVNKPNHYRMNIKGVQIEVMDIIEAILTPEEFRGYKKGNVLKYILREKLKNGLEDLKKCENYLKRLIQGDENAK